MAARPVCIAPVLAVVCFGMAAPLAAWAEPGRFYVRLGASLSAPWGGESIVRSEVATDSMSIIERGEFSLGAGAGLDLAFGYVLVDSLALEFAVGYFSGFAAVTDSSLSHGGDFISETSSISGTAIKLQPSIVLRNRLSWATAYGRLGILAAIPSVKAEQTSTGGGVTTKRQLEMSGGAAVGITSAAGLEFALSTRVGFFVEVASLVMSYKPTRGNVLSLTENGVDKFGSLTTRQKEVEFYDILTIHDDPNPNQGAPRKVPAIRLPFSSVGVGVGAKFAF